MFAQVSAVLPDERDEPRKLDLISVIGMPPYLIHIYHRHASVTDFHPCLSGKVHSLRARGRDHFGRERIAQQRLASHGLYHASGRGLCSPRRPGSANRGGPKADRVKRQLEGIAQDYERSAKQEQALADTAKKKTSGQHCGGNSYRSTCSCFVHAERTPPPGVRSPPYLHFTYCIVCATPRTDRDGLARRP
jgi:hypothetical protein